MSNSQMTQTDIQKSLQGSGLSAADAARLASSSSSIIMNNALRATGIIPQLEEEDLTHIVVILDHSASMSGDVQEVNNGFQEMWKAADEAKESHRMMMSVIRFADPGQPSIRVIQPSALLQDNGLWNNYRYSCDGGFTAMYDGVAFAYAYALTENATLAGNGIRVKTVFVVITDGEENASQIYNSADIQRMTQDLINKEMYIFAYIGIRVPQHAAIAAAQSMGFPLQDVLRVGDTGTTLRKAMGMISRSSIRVSTGAVNPKQVNSGGTSFFNP